MENYRMRQGAAYQNASSRETIYRSSGKRTSENVDMMPLAMAYIPWQTFKSTYDLKQGLSAGTIFPELHKPFYGKRGMM